MPGRCVRVRHKTRTRAHTHVHYRTEHAHDTRESAPHACSHRNGVQLTCSRVRPCASLVRARRHAFEQLPRCWRVSARFWRSGILRVNYAPHRTANTNLLFMFDCEVCGLWLNWNFCQKHYGRLYGRFLSRLVLIGANTEFEFILMGLLCVYLDGMLHTNTYTHKK